MRKTYMMLFALVLIALGATKANAGEIISLQEVPFCSWDGWGVDAQKTGEAECAWVVGESTGQPYGDSQVINYADLSLYSKLIVTVTEGTPRFLFNRDVDEGQWAENEEESHLIDNTRNGWSSKYFSVDGSTYTVDLKLMVKEKGFAHLHAIKGANWANVTVESMEVERQGKAQQVGWTELLTNGDLEGDDVSCFYSKENGGEPFPSIITDGIGVNESRGIMVHSAAGADQDWDAQFWINLPEILPQGTKYRVSFDRRASMDGTADTQAHADPSDYIHYEMIGSPTFTTEWQTYKFEGEITASQAGPNGSGGLMHSIAFNLSKDRNNDVDFFFDNLKFEVYKYGTMAEYYMDIVQVDFGFDTNIPALVKASGKSRLIFPEGCAKVTADGKEMVVMSVEGFADGRFYVFTEEALDDNATIEVSFTNPKDPAYHLIYTSGPGGDVNDWSGEADLNEDVAKEDAYAFVFVRPTVMSTDPEDGSFNLPNSIKEFTVNFDKPADCSVLKATINGKALTVSPNTGAAEVVKLIRQDSGDLPTGEYTIKVTNILAEEPLVPDDLGDYTFVLNVGKVDNDPNDVPRELIPAEYFANTAANGIPEGFIVMFGEELRTSEGSFGSGPRLFNFGEGGDFTKGLYFREGYAEYGSVENHALQLEAGKKYDFRFNTAAWKDNGAWCRFEVLDQNDEAVVSEMINNKPNVNGGTGAVQGSTYTQIRYVPATTGYYRVRWTACDQGGNGGFFEVLLGNPSVRYIPNVVGVEETQLLNTALENAKAVRDANSADRYSGPAFDALVAAIAKYEAEGPTYTAPSAYKNAAAALDAAAQAVRDHRSLIDTYDPLPQRAQEIVDNNAEKKFSKTELYATLKAAAAKYATKVVETQVDPETGLEMQVEVVKVKDIKDDAELQAAIAELKDLVNTTGLLFTEGESKTADTGIKVLVERLRLGAEGLKQLGVAEEDDMVQAAYNALTDDDDLANSIKNRMKLILYENLKDPNNALFEATIDPLTEEIVTPAYDMTVFVKNPNIYKQRADINFNEENVPGWVTPEGYSAPGLSWGWGSTQGTDVIAEDCMFQTWGGSYRVEQTITDLPVGIYQLRAGFGERQDENDAPNALDDTYFYVKTSDTPEEDVADRIDATRIGQAFPYAAEGSLGSLGIYDIVVTDGIVTLGVNACSGSHTFFSDVRVYICGGASKVDYSALYDEVLAGIDETVASNVRVRAIELFDLNGRRVTSAQRGVTIIRKYMSDGTVRTEKVMKK